MENLKEDKPFIVNGQKLTESEFRKKVEEINKMPHAQLVEVSPNNFKIRMYD